MCAEKIAALIILLNFTALSQAIASQPQASGRINMTGSIIESACAIDTSSRDQTVEMGLMPIHQIARNGQSINQPFSIRLVNCILTKDTKKRVEFQHFKITFDGKSEGDSFGLNGDAQGISLQISDKKGNVATPGSPLSMGDILPGDMSLNYSLRLVSNHQLLRAGDYFSTIKFKMDYY